jgi:hypothetical protein
MECVRIGDLRDLRNVFEGRTGHDFWLGSLAEVDARDMPEKLLSLRVEDELVDKVFSHCYVAESSNIKADSNALVDEFGLGLRKKRTTSHAVPGVVFVLTCNGGESILSQRRAALDGNDRRLSTEERVRKTALQFDVVTESVLLEEAKRHRPHFFLTSYSQVESETCKKRVICLKVDDKLAPERFVRCLIAETKNCQESTDRLTNLHGLGTRKTAVRSRSEPGCIVILFEKTSLNMLELGTVAMSSPAPTPDAEAAVVAAIGAEIAVKRRKTGKRAASPSEKTLEPAKRFDADMRHVSCNIAKNAPRQLATVRTAVGEREVGSASSDRGASCPGADATRSPMITTPAAAPKRVKALSPAKACTSHLGASAVRTAPATVADDAEGDRWYKQVKALEKRLQFLLPALPREQLSNAFVQAKLEQCMQLKTGKLDVFRADIGRIWRDYVRASPD